MSEHPTDGTARKARGVRVEKKALRMDWKEYILYCLEVDEEEINEDGLSDLVAVLNRSTDTESDL